MAQEEFQWGKNPIKVVTRSYCHFLPFHLHHLVKGLAATRKTAPEQMAGCGAKVYRGNSVRATIRMATIRMGALSSATKWIGHRNGPRPRVNGPIHRDIGGGGVYITGGLDWPEEIGRVLCAERGQWTLHCYSTLWKCVQHQIHSFQVSARSFCEILIKIPIAVPQSDRRKLAEYCVERGHWTLHCYSTFW